MGREEKSKHRLDLRGVACPLSWARTKVRLESLDRGEELRVILDDPKGARDIPRAAEACGYVVEDAVIPGGWELRIRV